MRAKDDPGPALLSPAEESALGCVLDEIVPPSAERGLPGAGELGLARSAAEALCAAPGARQALAQGLAALDAAARERGSADFAALAAPRRAELLRELGAGLSFFGALVFHTYAAYYQSARVLAALGREPRPPYPLGFAVAETDFALLDPVRRRPRLYRDA
jgi:hypothetical protein